MCSSVVFSVLKFMTISLEEEQQGEDEMQDVAANVDTFDDVVNSLYFCEPTYQPLRVNDGVTKHTF